MRSAIEARQLYKVFRVATARKGLVDTFRGLFQNTGREIKAVDGISFTVAAGSFVGYLGPNGAGKSTTIKMLTGILHPTSGEVRVAGVSPQRSRREVAQRIGVVFGQRTQLWWDLPVQDSLELLAAMYQVSPGDYRESVKKFDEMLGIGEFEDVPVRKLSLGQRMRADLAAAWLHRPPVVFLDEPTIGLDAVAKARIRTFLREINRSEGSTILLTTHDMDDIEELCSEVMVINHGRLVYSGNLAGLRSSVGIPTTMTVHFVRTPSRTPGGPWDVASEDGKAVTVTFDRSACAAGEVITRLTAYGEIRDVYMAEPDIEAIIARIYQAV